MTTSSESDAMQVCCSKCGTMVPRAKFCSECGTLLNANASPRERVEERAAPVVRRQAGATREWLRALDRGGALSIDVRPEHAVAVAAALRVVRDERLISDEAFKALQNRALRFVGPGLRRWTVGLGSLRWNELRDGKWEQADPPPWVWLEAPIRPHAGRTAHEIHRMPASEPLQRPAALTCTHCGLSIAAGKKFCTGCGTPVEEVGGST